MKKREGISLIVLVITIIVIIILAGAVILSLANNNPIAQATEATFKSDLDQQKSELTMYLSNKYVESKGSLALGTVTATTYNAKKDIISAWSNNPAAAAKFDIYAGKLVYIGNDPKEIQWAKEAGIQISYIRNGLMLWLDGSDFINSPTTTTWIDRSGNGNNVTPNKFAYTANSGSDGYGGVNFDGINDACTLASSINLGTEWTVETKVMYTNNNKSFEFFSGGAGNSGPIGKILLRYNGNVSYSYPANTYTNFNVTSASISNRVSTLTFVSNRTNVKLYVDGVLKDTINIASAPLDISTIGNAWSDEVWLSKFNLYSFRCYNRALSDTEILYNYNLGQ